MSRSVRTSRSTTTAYSPSLPPKCSYTTGLDTDAREAISSTVVPRGTILLLHGFADAAGSFDLVAPALAAAGYRVVQGHRTFKNLDSPFAVLDACNEEINNHIFRLGHARLGMSSSLIGSGMAFEYGYLQQLLHDIGETAGEDKEIDFRILRDHVKIAYLPEAFVYDEKIASAAVFGPQRTRWMAAQKEFLVKYFGEGFVQAGRGNWEFFDKILQTSLLPRVLLLGVLGVLLLSSLVLPFGPAPLCWAALLGGTGVALLLALPRRLYSWQVLRAAAHLPVALGAMALALLQLKKAKHSFLPTPHAGSPASVR